ncbi:MAG: bifunctional 5,10-methylenetetrahydrofolate dehydrogenase/5,10-methenyltetrahydrofolate cyclohydrolase [Candidatus Portiera sp.]|nr:bifunctional 5,10-methylenetetrahydrofolate dehydrogenase/5,10-methenyltetrahydrofolate cyclohydrolase [Portiera sp.]
MNKEFFHIRDKIIPGKEIASKYLEEVSQQVAIMQAKHNISPKLSVVIVGADPASHIYVANKIKTCAKVGITSQLYKLPALTSEKELLALVNELNKEKENHGILVQLPLPDHIDNNKIISAINQYKDVDGFHPQNIASLYLNNTTKSFVPCTPLGCYRLLQKIGFELHGSNVAIVGRSNIVGKPLAMLLLLKGNASISMVHSNSKSPHKITKQADLIVSAAGVPNLINSDWVKPGAVVIDVGMNRMEPSGKLQGDADFDALLPIVKAITPVPGGVGPMTIAMLMENCVKAAKVSLKIV